MARRSMARLSASVAIWIFLILTKRPRLIPSRFTGRTGGEGYRNVWLGTTCGVRSSYPRLDDLAQTYPPRRASSPQSHFLKGLADINLQNYGWLIAGGWKAARAYRPMREEWGRGGCVMPAAAQGVAYHFKQAQCLFRAGTDPYLKRGVQYHESPLVQIESGRVGRRAAQLSFDPAFR